MKRLLSVAGGALMAVTLAMSANAQVGVSLVLRSGERVSGTLVDMRSDGFEVTVGGQTRKWTVEQIAVLDYTGALFTFPSKEVDQAGGEHVLVLRNGQIIKGTLVDLGGRIPQRVTFSSAGTSRDYTSYDVARIYFAKPPAGSSGGTGGGTSAEGLAPATGRVRVAGTAGWVDTGLVVSQGQTLLFNSTGEVRLSADNDDVAGPAGSKKGRYASRAPVPSVLAGALIGRIGNGAPFAIGNQTSIPSPGSGALWLAVNDDGLADNAGAFGIDVTAQARPRR